MVHFTPSRRVTHRSRIWFRARERRRQRTPRVDRRVAEDARVDVIVGDVFVARDARGEGSRARARVVARGRARDSWDAGPARGGARRRAWERE